MPPYAFITTFSNNIQNVSPDDVFTYDTFNTRSEAEKYADYSGDKGHVVDLEKLKRKNRSLYDYVTGSAKSFYENESYTNETVIADLWLNILSKCGDEIELIASLIPKTSLSRDIISAFEELNRNIEK